MPTNRRKTSQIMVYVMEYYTRPQGRGDIIHATTKKFSKNQFNAKNGSKVCVKNVSIDMLNLCVCPCTWAYTHMHKYEPIW